MSVKFMHVNANSAPVCDTISMKMLRHNIIRSLTGRRVTRTAALPRNSSVVCSNGHALINSHIYLAADTVVEKPQDVPIASSGKSDSSLNTVTCM